MATHPLTIPYKTTKFNASHFDWRCSRGARRHQTSHTRHTGGATILHPIDLFWNHSRIISGLEGMKSM